MKEPKWLTEAMIDAIHHEALHYFGGPQGVRDGSLLQSAIDRPQTKWLYRSRPSIFELAASLGWRIARNHPYVDGNKRTGLLSSRAFLFLNGKILEPAEEDEVLTMLGVVSGAISELQFADWLKRNCKSVRSKRILKRP